MFPLNPSTIFHLILIGVILSSALALQIGWRWRILLVLLAVVLPAGFLWSDPPTGQNAGLGYTIVAGAFVVALILGIIFGTALTKGTQPFSSLWTNTPGAMGRPSSRSQRRNNSLFRERGGISMDAKKTKMLTSILLLGTLIIPALASGQEKYQTLAGEKVYESVSNGLKFFHFRFKLTPKNTILPTDERILRRGYKRNPKNYRMEIGDEKSGVFEFGMFHVFIPAAQFPFANNTDGLIILRMPQTLTWKYERAERKYERAERYVRAKQDLFFRIKKMVENRKGSLDVVIELPRDAEGILMVERNVYFRSGGGAYINYVGQYKGASNGSNN